MNAKMLTNYAAYCAARAGILFNGDRTEMNEAAAIALIPCFARNLQTIVSAGSYAQAAAQAGVDLRVDILSPGPGRFASNYRGRFFPVMDRGFRTEQELRDNLLRVRVTCRFPLTIPLVNTFMQPLFTGRPSVKISSVCEMQMQSDAISMLSD
jgi:hypothetical protein